MATKNKNFRKKVRMEDQVLPYDSSERVKLVAFGYKENPKYGVFTTIQAVDQISCVLVEDISGDELITIKYKNGEQEFHDGSDCRIMNFHDGSSLLTTEEEIDRFIIKHLYKNA